MEKRSKKNLSRMTMIIAAFLLVTAIGIGVYAATQLTRTGGTNVKFSASLGVSMTVTAQQYDDEDAAVGSEETLRFGGTKATDRQETDSDSFTTIFNLADDEYVLYTFKFKLSSTNYDDSNSVPYSIVLDSSEGFDVSVISGSATGTMTTAEITVVFKVAAPTTPGKISIDENLTFTATFGA